MSATTTPAPLRVPSRPDIQVVPRPRSAPRAPFVVLVIVLLVGGLAAILVLNTLLAQGAFAVRDLSIQASDLQDRQQALQQRVAQLAAPQRLAHSAADLGMVPTVNPAFLRMSDGKILGDPVPAHAPIVVAPPVTSSSTTQNHHQDQPANQDQQGSQGQQQDQQHSQQNSGGQGSADSGNNR